VAVGILLWMFVSKGFLFVAGIGAFGPGVLRELGWLRDHDEFQRQAARRAGYHAYLVGGLAAVAVLALLEWTSMSAEDATEWILFIIVVLWLTWMFSALLSYWGAKKTVSVLLRTVGSFWAVFVIAELVGEFRVPHSLEDVKLTLIGFGAGTMFVAPFFVLAWTVNRWPRATAYALIGVAVLLFLVLFRTPDLPWSTVVMTRLMLIGPLLATGIAVLREVAHPSESEGG
jgi:hypothetical protein